MANDTGDLTPLGLLLVTFQYGGGAQIALSRVSP
jgi:hypothetical protein